MVLVAIAACASATPPPNDETTERACKPAHPGAQAVVVGEVIHPGSMPVGAGATAADLIAKAGGATVIGAYVFLTRECSTGKQWRGIVRLDAAGTVRLEGGETISVQPAI